MRKRVELEKRLQDIVTHEGLVLQYQPVHDVFVLDITVMVRPRRSASIKWRLTSTTAQLEQGCCEPAELFSLGYPLSAHVPKRVHPRQ